MFAMISRPAVLLDSLPGLALAAAIAGVATLLHRLPGIGVVSPMILAIVVGVAINNLAGTPAWARVGLAVAMRQVLRGGIVLLGLQITPPKLVAIGLPGFAVVVVTLAATFAFTLWFGQILGVRRQLTELVAAGTSICGASAIIATNGVTGGSREDVAYAVATVTLFGTLSMFLFPLLVGPLGLSPHAFGLWTGASIHEIAQVVAAAFQDGPQAGEFATITKLARVMLMAPLVIGLGAWRSRGASAGAGPAARPPFPWFVVGFLALVGFGGVVSVPPATTAMIATFTTFLLTMALGAMGLAIHLRKLADEGPRPLGLAAASWIFVSIFALLAVKLVT